ncbi:hypothetical protein MKW98_026842 [Papaver atlanticum]|uniref:Uncharacterized protein n=1 Tax=Papaver atlanticum TaxID=357466 RepID=A0AAD4S1K5_9MAGN|nr:hypothetical protein MKW98_026842 [Papaver atlanticum]
MLFLCVMCTGKLRKLFNAIKDLVKEIKPIGLTERAERYLRRGAYGKLVMIYYEEYDAADASTTKQISTNKHGVVNLLNCFDRDGEIPCSFKFGDDKFIQSTPAKFAGILGMQRIGSRKGQKLLKYFSLNELDDNILYNKYFTNIKDTAHPTTVTKKKIIEELKQVMSKRERTKLDDRHVVCLIGLYLCCVLFFGDVHASGVNVRFLSIVETYETVLKVSWPDLVHEYLFDQILNNDNCVSNVKACVPYILMLFAEHTPAGSIEKVTNHEQQIPRVGRWDLKVISDFIAGANMTEFSVSVLYY